jgi:hypothetical protein
MNTLIDPFVVTSAKGAVWLLVWSWQAAVLLACVWAGLKIFRVESVAIRTDRIQRRSRSCPHAFSNEPDGSTKQAGQQLKNRLFQAHTQGFQQAFEPHLFEASILASLLLPD